MHGAWRALKFTWHPIRSSCFYLTIHQIDKFSCYKSEAQKCGIRTDIFSAKTQKHKFTVFVEKVPESACRNAFSRKNSNLQYSNSVCLCAIQFSANARATDASSERSRCSENQRSKPPFILGNTNCCLFIMCCVHLGTE